MCNILCNAYEWWTCCTAVKDLRSCSSSTDSRLDLVSNPALARAWMSGSSAGENKLVIIIDREILLGATLAVNNFYEVNLIHFCLSVDDTNSVLYNAMLTKAEADKRPYALRSCSSSTDWRLDLVSKSAPARAKMSALWAGASGVVKYPDGNGFPRSYNSFWCFIWS